MYARSTSGLSARLEPDSTQYWLLHRTRVDVPSMYRPRGRYRYTHGIVSSCDVDTFHFSENVLQNWRAATAMVVSVPPTFPGLIDSIKASANVGAGPHLFDIAYMLAVRFSPP
jgi:nucleobase:cation symporter-1, NCS1 family